MVRNALQHSDSGSTVVVNGTGNVEFATITIRDFGPGVPESALHDIFGPFYRVRSDFMRDADGAGLGLSIARRAIEVHRGSISAQNSPPGLSVEIRLPRL